MRWRASIPWDLSVIYSLFYLTGCERLLYKFAKLTAYEKVYTLIKASEAAGKPDETVTSSRMTPQIKRMEKKLKRIADKLTLRDTQTCERIRDLELFLSQNRCMTKEHVYSNKKIFTLQRDTK